MITRIYDQLILFISFHNDFKHKYVFELNVHLMTVLDISKIKTTTIKKIILI